MSGSTRPGETQADIHERFRKELREQELPKSISLHGDPMLVAIATLLLGLHAPHIRIAGPHPASGAQRGAANPEGDSGEAEGGSEPVHLYSLEDFGAAFLASFLEEREPPAGRMLLYSIPEAQLEEHARRHGISVVHTGKDDVRQMLDRIAEQQPQTYFSLARSSRRLLEQFRPRDGKELKPPRS